MILQKPVRQGSWILWGMVSHCPFLLRRLYRDTSLSKMEIARAVFWCLPKAVKGDTNKT